MDGCVLIDVCVIMVGINTVGSMTNCLKFGKLLLNMLNCNSFVNISRLIKMIYLLNAINGISNNNHNVFKIKLMFVIDVRI